MGCRELLLTVCVLASSCTPRAVEAPAETPDRIFVSIGSDDWGRWSQHGPLWPNLETREWFGNEGLWLSGGELSKTTAETDDDLRELWALIEAVNEGQPPASRVVLTPFWIVAGPDFEAMRDAGCLDGAGHCEYKELWWHNSSGGLDRPPFERGDLRALYQEGFARGLWHPEYHGRSHFDTAAWAAYLAEGDHITALYFEAGLTYYHYGRLNASSRSFHSIHSEYLSDDGQFQKGPAQLTAWTHEGLRAFEAFWGYASRVTAMPCHYGGPEMGGVFAAAGVAGVEGEEKGRGLLPGLRNSPRLMFDPAFESPRAWEDVLAHTQREAERLVAASLRAPGAWDGARGAGFLTLQWHSLNALAATFAPEEAAADPRAGVVGGSLALARAPAQLPLDARRGHRAARGAPARVAGANARLPLTDAPRPPGARRVRGRRRWGGGPGALS